MKYLGVGKLGHEMLEQLLGRYCSSSDPRLVVPPKVGEDAGVIDMGDKYLVVASDPITFATDQIGWYAVQVNANDVYVMGAKPTFFNPIVLLPENITKGEIERIFSQMHEACNKLEVAVATGHTEITPSLDRPIIAGCMLGEVEKTHLVTSSGAQVGDYVILTNGIAIEGTSIIAREKQEELRERGYDEEFIERAMDYLHHPGISIALDAQLACEVGVNAMHDITEGGVVTGVYEMIRASEKGVVINEKDILVLPEAQRLCEGFGLDVYKLISSGSLLLAVDPSKVRKLLGLYEDKGIQAARIGEVIGEGCGLTIRRERKDFDLEQELPEMDEIARLFEANGDVE